MKREIQEIKVYREKGVTLEYKENRGLQEFRVRKEMLVLRVILV